MLGDQDNNALDGGCCPDYTRLGELMNEQETLQRIRCCTDALLHLLIDVCNDEHEWKSENDPDSKAVLARELVSDVGNHVDTFYELTQIIAQTADARMAAVEKELEEKG